MNTPLLQFVRRGAIVSLPNVPPSRTLLQVLREDLHSTDTKEGCNEGDCGACTVVLGELNGQHIRYRAVNSCIRLAHSINGMAVWTAQDLLSFDGTLHPAQQAMVQCHASQCGFCTPGFVMSLFGLYQNHVTHGEPVTRELAQEALSGNLCRCTGYRPILDAAQQMAQLAPAAVNEADLLQKLKQLAKIKHALQPDSSYISPATLGEFLADRAAHPDAQLVAGCTDVGLWVTKQHRQFAKVLDVSRVRELKNIEDYPHHIAIGAAVTLTDAFATLVQDRPQLQAFASRFAGLPVRNSGTLGGNVANGSPIGDSMPLLIALGANVVLMSLRGGQIHHREMALEALYTGYRQTLLQADEVLTWIKVPKPRPSELCRVYKISKRFEDDISAVCLAIHLQLENEQVMQASIGVGGVAATPVRASQTEVALRGQAWTQDSVQSAIHVLRSEFAPLSDLRASADYRQQVLGNLLQRFWLESQGQHNINLESFAWEGEAL
jgi:xanthine dehydrogenase small subunit